MSTVLNLRGIPEDLLRRAKATAAMQGITLKQFVVQAIAQALKQAGALSLAASKKPRR